MKTEVLSTRITAPLRAALEKSAAASNSTLSKQIEYLLWRGLAAEKLVKSPKEIAGVLVALSKALTTNQK